MAKRLGIALVGCGPISERHLRSWACIPEVEVVALCDRHPENMERAVALFPGKRMFTDFGELLKEVEFEVADIATRPYSHQELVAQAARAGKHILCQKPFAVDLSEARQMIAEAERNHIRLMVCENWRWFAWFQLIRQLLSDGQIGTVKYASMTAHSSFALPKGNTPAAILRDPQVYLKDMDRLLVYEAAIHLVDVFRFLFGDADSVYARMGQMCAEIRGEDHCLIVLNHGSMYGSIDASWCSREPQEQNKCEHLLIEGTDGTIILEQTGRVVILRDDGTAIYPELEWQEETKLKSHFRVHRHFVDGLLTNRPFQTDARDNIKTLEIVLKAYESAQNDRVVALQKDALLTDE
jgi:predicted dehydrogenase